MSSAGGLYMEVLIPNRFSDPDVCSTHGPTGGSVGERCVLVSLNSRTVWSPGASFSVRWGREEVCVGRRYFNKGG